MEKLPQIAENEQKLDLQYRIYNCKRLVRIKNKHSAMIQSYKIVD